MSPSKGPAPEPAEPTLEQHESWEDLLEWLRFPGKDDDVEAFVWALGERFKVIRKPPPHAGPRAPAIDLNGLVDALMAHFHVEHAASDEARAELSANLARCDLDFVEAD